MSERVTEMSHTQAHLMLDLILSDEGVQADLDAKALVNLAETAYTLGRDDDAERLLAELGSGETDNAWAGLAHAKILISQGDDSGLELTAEVIENARTTDDQTLLAAALNIRSQAEANTGDVDKAVETQAESLAIKTAIGDVRGQANGHHNMLQFAKQMDALEDALTHAKRLVDLTDELQDRGWHMNALADIAHLTACAGNFEEAEAQYKQSLDIAEAEEDVSGLVVANWGLADLFLIQGDGELALTHYSQALASHMQSDVPAPAALLQRIEALTGNGAEVGGGENS